MSEKKEPSSEEIVKALADVKLASGVDAVTAIQEIQLAYFNLYNKPTPEDERSPVSVTIMVRPIYGNRGETETAIMSNLPPDLVGAFLHVVSHQLLDKQFPPPENEMPKVISGTQVGNA